MPDSTYHQIHFAWAEPTLLGRTGPGPAAASLPERDHPVLRSWRDRLVPALTADYRSALPDTDPADFPETLWAHDYPDGQSALVYRWPGDVRDAHAWAIVGPSYGLTLPRVLSLHENPNTRPAARRPPAPGWETMRSLAAPEPWERTAAPGAVRTRDRKAAETAVGDEPLLVGAVAAALARPDLPVHIALEPERADLWQAVQMRFLWGAHRILHDVLTPPRAIPAAGWAWSFSTYDPVLGEDNGQHIAFGPPVGDHGGSPFVNPVPPDFRRVAEGLVAVLRDEGGNALAAQLRERGVPDAATFADRRDLLCDWFDPRARPLTADPDDLPEPEPLPGVGLREPEPESADESGESAAPEKITGPGEEAGPEDSTAGTGPGAEESTATAEPEEVDGLPELLEVEEPGEEDPEEPDSTGPHRPRRASDDLIRRVPSRPVRPRIAAARPHNAPRTRTRAASEPLWPTGRAADRTDDGTGPEEPAFGGDDARPRNADAPEPRDTRSAPSLGLAEPGARSTDDASAADREAPTPPAAPPVDDAPDAPPIPDPPARTPGEAPPLPLTSEPPIDYASETEPDQDEADESGDDDNWPTQYVDLPLSRLERWHAKRGPEGARIDIVDARAAVRAERAELQRVREERDLYHTEVQDLRRDIARLDRSWLDPGGEPSEPDAPRLRRWPSRALAALVMLALLATGLEAGARFGHGTTDLLAALWGALPWG
ncbi:hypothetical protein [Nocardiopsis sp. NRRL B-16309]|uniref:hypothetical protein n=1 Tax=Nocardiopsis sp. NRRL B-16309 TaxID=1519494 RepID=UPI0006AF2792|nr:hypothetical protein [Nocardiopsis sp. NRRL B-16309]KOX12504.1 hypothetical protein ADL05_21785 [Nocardiopsis sp. NRRL B-16309]